MKPTELIKIKVTGSTASEVMLTYFTIDDNKRFNQCKDKLKSSETKDAILQELKIAVGKLNDSYAHFMELQNKIIEKWGV